MKFDPCIQPSVDYIAQHLMDELDLEEIARASGYSLSNFYRLFQALTGFTLKEFIRNQRLAHAAHELVNTRRRILDIALDCGFNSQEVSSRAFVSLYDLTPGEFRRTRKDSLDQLSRMDSFARRMEQSSSRQPMEISVQADIIHRGWMHLAGMEIHTSVAENIDTLRIPHFWEAVFLPKIQQIKNRSLPNVTIAYEVLDPENDSLLHMACVETASPDPHSGMVSRTLEPGYYAAFTPRRLLDPYEYSALVRFAYGEWFPMSGCEIRAPFTLDLYIDQPTRDGRSINHQIMVLVPIHPPPAARLRVRQSPYAGRSLRTAHNPFRNGYTG